MSPRGHAMFLKYIRAATDNGSAALLAASGLIVAQLISGIVSLIHSLTLWQQDSCGNKFPTKGSKTHVGMGVHELLELARTSRRIFQRA
jgi:hypothetical protein